MVYTVTSVLSIVSIDGLFDYVFTGADRTEPRDRRLPNDRLEKIWNAEESV